MVNSMTGFASLGADYDGTNWAWEIRSVNGRGLEIRTRLPEGFEALEKTIKAQVSKHCARGNINIGLRLKTNNDGGMPVLNIANLDAAIDALKISEDRANEKGISLAVSRATDLLSIKGVLELSGPQMDNSDLLSAINDSFTKALHSFISARAEEGQSLQKIILKQIADIKKLTDKAHTLIVERQLETKKTFTENVQKIIENAEAVSEDRLLQELAILAVKSDVTEELDRLHAHIQAANMLMKTDGPIGRKFDFLTQEFNREANTLCSKSGYTELTQVGLELKTVIDQMREQVQNVE